MGGSLHLSLFEPGASNMSLDRGEVVASLVFGVLCVGLLGYCEYRDHGEVSQRKVEAAQKRLEIQQKEQLARQRVQFERQQRERAVAAEQARPAAARVESALKRLENADEDAIRSALCYARWLLDDALKDSGDVLKSLRRVEKKSSTRLLKRMQRDSDALRVYVCRDGNYSGCLCRKSRRGCCSSHGGIRRCEPSEKVTLSCPTIATSERILQHLAAMKDFQAPQQNHQDE